MPTYVVKRGRRKGDRKKREIDRMHCRNRAEERFDLVYTDSLRKKIIENIRKGRAIFVEKVSRTRSFFDNAVPGHPEIRVLYSKSTGEIVTMLDKRNTGKTGSCIDSDHNVQ